jgi:hypothetical protein
MRLTKSLLWIISALALATGAAFAGGGSMSHQGSMSYQSTEAAGPEPLGGYEVTSEGDVIGSNESPYESSSPELLSDAETWSGWSSSESSRFPMSSSDSLQPESESLAESDVIYIYPMQVTEYYVLVPSVDTETPRGG